MDVDQHSTGNHVALSQGDLRIWTARSSTHAKVGYIAVFNLGDAAIAAEIPWSKIGAGGPSSRHQNLWTNEALSPMKALKVQLPAHSSAMYRVAVP